MRSQPSSGKYSSGRKYSQRSHDVSIVGSWMPQTDDAAAGVVGYRALADAQLTTIGGTEVIEHFHRYLQPTGRCRKSSTNAWRVLQYHVASSSGQWTVVNPVPRLRSLARGSSLHPLQVSVVASMCLPFLKRRAALAEYGQSTFCNSLTTRQSSPGGGQPGTSINRNHLLDPADNCSRHGTRRQ